MKDGRRFPFNDTLYPRLPTSIFLKNVGSGLSDDTTPSWETPEKTGYLLVVYQKNKYLSVSHYTNSVKFQNRLQEEEFKDS